MSNEDPRVIKRYANRKLYDTARRQFTTLDELSGLLEKGVRFVVRDHDSGSDRTDEVLAQVLGRRVRSSGGAGSGDLLSGLLRAPTQIAQQLVDEATGSATRGTGDTSTKSGKDKPKGKKKSGSGKKSGAKKSGSGKGKGTKRAAGDEAEAERQQQEIQELRNQVSELTQAVSMLVQDRLAERGADTDQDDTDQEGAVEK